MSGRSWLGGIATVVAGATAVVTLTFTSAVQALPSDFAGSVTGGGTVLAAPAFPFIESSFGLNASRPAGFVGGGAAVGRIEYNRQQVNGNEVNVPVVLMAGEATVTPSPNGTGGSAVLVGDCTASTAQCPAGAASVLVSVEDNSDSGLGADVFVISFCSGFPSLPAPAGCGALEGGTLRSGNIQVRPAA